MADKDKDEKKDAEAAAITPAKVLSGPDNWMPGFFGAV